MISRLLAMCAGFPTSISHGCRNPGILRSDTLKPARPLMFLSNCHQCCCTVSLSPARIDLKTYLLLVSTRVQQRPHRGSRHQSLHMFNENRVASSVLDYAYIPVAAPGKGDTCGGQLPSMFLTYETSREIPSYRGWIIMCLTFYLQWISTDDSKRSTDRFIPDSVPSR